MNGRRAKQLGAFVKALGKDGKRYSKRSAKRKWTAVPRNLRGRISDEIDVFIQRAAKAAAAAAAPAAEAAP